MIYIIILLAVCFLGMGATVIIYNKLYHKFEDAYEQEKIKLEGVQEEYSRLVEAYNIKKNNKEKADEKISDLHSGTLSADDILPKRKN